MSLFRMLSPRRILGERLVADFIPPTTVPLGRRPDAIPLQIRALIGTARNPSFLRAPGSSTFSAQLENGDIAVLSCPGDEPSRPAACTTNLTSTRIRPSSQHLGGNPIKDLKWFEHREEPWFTFNTGHPASPKAKNDVFLGPLSTLDRFPPYRAVFRERRRIEKNWGFFELQGRLFAVYSIEPFRLLYSTGIDLKRREMLFDEVLSTRKTSISVPDRLSGSILAQGTPPVIWDGRFWAVVNEKKYFLKKYRAYFPRVTAFRISGMDLTDITFGPPLMHDLGNLKEPSPKNPFAFGVTYGSGFGFFSGKPFLGYGLADSDYRVVELSEQELPPLGQS